MILDSFPSIYLASASPRRRELLAQVGVRHELLLAHPGEAEVDESVLAAESPTQYVERVCLAKVQAGCARLQARALPLRAVLAADTTVALGARILAKPADRIEAAQMLRALSGRSHEVLTAVALSLGGRTLHALSRSEVRFRALGEDEIGHYLASGEADDKAGAYAIQGRAGQFVAQLGGSYSGVMGLPLFETARLIEQMLDGA
jgi:septum formation protein